VRLLKHLSWKQNHGVIGKVERETKEAGQTLIRKCLHCVDVKLMLDLILVWCNNAFDAEAKTTAAHLLMFPQFNVDCRSFSYAKSHRNHETDTF
jgi:hypothetical protein